MDRRFGQVGGFAGLALLLLPLLAAAESGGDVALVEVRPAREDSLLVCTVSTRGLPNGPARETLTSGLPSALVVAFTVLDLKGEEIGGSRAEVRIEPDLWENLFWIHTPWLDQRAPSLEAVGELLREIGPLPVLPLSQLDSGKRIQVRSRLAIHPLAPTEILRVQALFGGEPTEGEADRRETSVGLGNLVRYFLGKNPEEEWVSEAISPPFSWDAFGEIP